MAKKLCLSLLICLIVTTVHGQLKYPQGLPPTAKAMKMQQFYCIVYAEHLWSNCIVYLYDENNLMIGYALSDINGNATIIYNCIFKPYSITTCLLFSGCIDVLVSQESTLPVKLTGFKADILKNNSVELKWKSEMEEGALNYIIQKSYDGKAFVDIGQVKAAGNSNESINYSFNDNRFHAVSVYYRLKQQDIDGHYEFSKVLHVNKDNSGNRKSVGPNPFTTEIKIFGLKPGEFDARKIRMYNAYGQIIDYRIAGENSIIIHSSAPAGIYFLHAGDEIFRLVKNR